MADAFVANRTELPLYRYTFLIAQGLLSLLFVVLAWGPLLGLGRGDQTFNLRVADLLLPMTVVAFCLLWLLQGRIPLDLRRFRQTPFLIVFVIFAMWASASLFVAIEPIVTLRRLVRVWLLLLLAVGIVDFAPALRQVRVLLAVHIVIQALIGLGQYSLQHDVGLHFLGEQEMRAELGFNVLQTADRLVLRAQGLAEHPNLFAITLVVPLLIVLGGFVQSVGRQRVAWLLVLTVGCMALFFAFSRAATFGGALAIVYFMLADGRRRRGWGKYTQGLAMVGVIVLLLLAYFNRDVLLTRINPNGSVLEWVSVNERMLQNLVGLRMVQASPLFGVGAGNGRFLFLEYLGNEPYISRVIHNAVMLISAETGLLNGLLWLTILITPPLYGILNRKTLSIDALVLSAALVPYLVTDFTSPASWDTPVGSLLRWMVLALWLRVIYGNADDADGRGRKDFVA